MIIKDGELVMNYEIEFESDNIIYTKMSERLLDDYLKMYNDKEIQRVLFRSEKTFKDEHILNWIKRVRENNEYTFSMIEKSTGEYIGNVEIINIKDDMGEIAITITPNKQNKHYGTEAMKAIINYGYSNLNLKEVVVNVYKSNIRAVNLYKNVGFKLDSDKDNVIHMKHQK